MERKRKMESHPTAEGYPPLSTSSPDLLGKPQPFVLYSRLSDRTPRLPLTLVSARKARMASQPRAPIA
jgi:hypothetical protein